MVEVITWNYIGFAQFLLPLGLLQQLVVPEQPWLDGFNIGNGVIRQFVAMPLGMSYTVEGQLTREERFGGVQILVYPPISLELIAGIHR